MQPKPSNGRLEGQYVHEVAREYRGSAGAHVLYIPVNINVVAVTGGGRV